MAQKEVVEALTEDNNKVEELFKQFEAGEGDKRMVAVQAIAALTVQSLVKEKEFYPVINESLPEGKKLVRAAEKEQNQIRRVIAKISAFEPDEELDREMQELMAATRTQAEHEANDLLPMLHEHMDDKQLSQLGKSLANARKQIVSVVR